MSLLFFLQHCTPFSRILMRRFEIKLNQILNFFFFLKNWTFFNIWILFSFFLLTSVLKKCLSLKLFRQIISVYWLNILYWLLFFLLKLKALTHGSNFLIRIYLWLTLQIYIFPNCFQQLSFFSFYSVNELF